MQSLVSVITGCTVYTHGGIAVKLLRSIHARYTSLPALTLLTWPINTVFVAARWLLIRTRTDVTESVYVAVWLILVSVALLNSVTA